MRITALVAAALLSSTTAAVAAPASVTVTVGPELQKKAVETYGVRDVDHLATELRTDVERELTRTGAFGGARIELVLVDAKPNRPTFKQLLDVQVSPTRASELAARRSRVGRSRPVAR
jgi:hypothetical protein